jgi:hypothetical protein
MKRLLLVLLGGMIAALLSGAVLIWYATGDAMLSVIMANMRYVKRQMPVDYDQLIVGSHFLSPTVTMTNPSLRFSTSHGQYKLVATEVKFIGSLSSLGEYKIVLPPKFLLEKMGAQNETTLFEVRDYPEIEVRSSEPVEGQPAEAIYLDEFKLEKHKKLALEIAVNQKPMQLSFTPPDFLTVKWTPIHYEVTPYLARFTDSTERMTHGAAALTP